MASEKKKKELMAQLASSDDAVVIKALNELEGDGDASFIPLMINLLETGSDQVVSIIVEMLSSLKDSSAAKEIIEVLREEENPAVKQLVLSTIWNTNIDYSEYLPDFVLWACEGDYLVALDCLTIIENTVFNAEERHILEAQWHLKEFFESSPTMDEQKKQIISDIAEFIKNADLEIDG